MYRRTRTNFDLQEAGGTDHHITNVEGYQLVTNCAAEQLECGDVLGQIKVGYIADMIVVKRAWSIPPMYKHVKSSNFIGNRAFSEVALTLKAGEVVYRK
jgi:imidazolonepropionase-like amidohydrolase